MRRPYKFIKILLLLMVVPLTGITQAQILEPDVEKIERDISTLKDNYGTGFGFGFVMNNFGFGAGGEFRAVIAPQTEFTTSLRITALRDPSEQTFTDFFFGQQIVPNKYQRAFASPLLLGFRHRLFPDIIQENYRVFLSAAIGPAVAFSYPYFEDRNDFGYRFTGNELTVIDDVLYRIDPMRVNDIFTGMGDGEWHWGGAGEFKLGLDIGSNFARLSSIEFGYFFYYFPNAIQIMMPNQPVFRTDVPRSDIVLLDDNGNYVFDEFYDKQSYFGSPQITFTFGWLW